MKTGISILLVLLCTLIHAQDKLEEILNSRRIDHELTLKVKSTSRVEYSFYDKKDKLYVYKSLDSINQFQSNDEEFRIYVEFVNPLNYKITYSGKETENTTYTKANEYMTNAIEYISIFSPQLNAFKSARPVSVINDTIIFTDPQLLEIYYLIFQGDPTLLIHNKKYTQLANVMARLKYETEKKQILEMTSSIFNNLKGIEKVSEISSLLLKNKVLVDSIKKKLRELAERFDDVNDEFAIKLPASSKNIVHVLANNRLKIIENEFKGFNSDISKVLDTNYSTLAKLFTGIVEEADPEKNRFLLSSINLKKEKIQDVTLKIEKLKFDNKTKVISSKESKSYKIILRRYRNFIPVVSTGIYYTTLSFNQFGSEIDGNGDLTVTNAVDELNEFTSSAHINFYRNSTKGPDWFWQFGVGPTKEKPLFALGVGIRILESLNLSAGGVWTWQPELKSLQAGSVINSTTDIDNDLRYKFHEIPRFYFGLSYNLSK